jgi:chaperonin cofactor prefoldin
MTGWDILNELIKSFSPIAAMLFLLVTGVIFVIGFFRYGFSFIKYGFKQTVLDNSLDKRFEDFDKRLDKRFEAIDKRFEDFEMRIEKRFDDIDRRFEAIDRRFDAFDKRFDAFEQSVDKRFDKMDLRIDGLQTELEYVKSNHFGHLKNFLTELTSILVDRGVINNENKARLDNQLRGM